MTKDKRHKKEAKMQEADSMIRQYELYDKLYSEKRLTGSGVLLRISELGGRETEVFMYGEHFDDIVRPAIKEAMKLSLARKRDFLQGAVRIANGMEERYAKQ